MTVGTETAGPVLAKISVLPPGVKVVAGVLIRMNRDSWCCAQETGGSLNVKVTIAPGAALRAARRGGTVPRPSVR